MTIVAERVDLVIQKGAKFYQEFQFVQDDLQPITMVGKTLKCTIKESQKSPLVLHTLTEDNGGMIMLDAAQGSFAMYIEADETNVSVDYGLYDIITIEDDYPTTEIERIIEGKVTYTQRVTV